MNVFTLSSTVDLPLFNKVAITVINFAVVALLLTVFNHNKYKDFQSRVFFLMGVLMLCWVDFAYLARLVGGVQIVQSEIFLRTAWIATPLLFYSTYLTSIYVIKKENKYRHICMILLILALILSGLTAFTNFIIEGVEFTGTNLDIVYGAGFYPFLLVIAVFMVFTLTPLLKTKLSQGSKVFLLGVVIFYLANMIFNIALPVFMNITHLYYIGDYSTIVLLGSTAYAIVRHKLFNIKIITTEALTIIIWIILFSKLFVTQTMTDLAVDILIFSLMVVFGIFLIRSVIREVKQREKLQELTNKLKEMDKQKDEFISMAAHELRSPMTAIKGYTSMILEGDAGNITERARGYLTDTKAVTDRSIRLVNNMLNVARIEEGRIVYQLEEETLIKAVQEIYHSFTFEADRKNLEYKLNVADGVVDRIYVDPDKLREVVGNLVSNAIKFTEKGKVEIKITNPTKETIKLEVIDTGPGISKKEQVKLFNKFYRAEATRGKTMGTGLGLYISKLLIDKFDGEIGLISDSGKGSNFWFELPLMKKNEKKEN